MTFTTPPSASEPYSTDIGPRTTSIRSIPSDGAQSYWKSEWPTQSSVEITRKPSIRNSVCLPSMPRSEIVLRPPTLWPSSVTPGVSRTASRVLSAPRSSRSQRVTTEAAAGTSRSACSRWVAVTTTSSRREPASGDAAPELAGNASARLICKAAAPFRTNPWRDARARPFLLDSCIVRNSLDRLPCCWLPIPEGFGCWRLTGEENLTCPGWPELAAGAALVWASARRGIAGSAYLTISRETLR